MATSTNPRRRKRKYTRRRRRRTYRRNPAPYVAAVANPRRRRTRSNPKLTGKLTKALGVAIPIMAGIMISRTLSRFVMKEKDYGVQGAVAQIGAGLGLGWLGASFLGQKEAGLLAGGAMAAAGLRLVSSQYPQLGLTLGDVDAFKDTGLVVSSNEAQGMLNDQAARFQQEIGGYFDRDQLPRAMNVGQVGMGAGGWTPNMVEGAEYPYPDDMAGYYQGDPLSIHNRVW